MGRIAEPFAGDHCETVTLGTLFGVAGLSLTEAELFGLGRGLGFFLLPDALMRMPMLAGRIEPGEILENAAHACGVKIHKLTGSGEQAWEGLLKALTANQPVAVQLDCYYLEYFRRPVHFAGHWVAVVGYENENVWLAETQSQGGLCSTSRESFMQAWGESAVPLSDPWKGWVLEGAPTFEATALREAMRLNAVEYLARAAWAFDEAVAQLPEWLKDEQGAKDAARAAVLAERAGTGGANFRRLFSRAVEGVFPEQAVVWQQISQEWERLSELLAQYGEDKKEQSAQEVVVLFSYLAKMEREAVRELSEMSG